jgi:hypothetical protein
LGRGQPKLIPSARASVLRFRQPIEWNHLVENELVESKELEQALDEKAGQLSEGPALAPDSTHYLKPKSAVVPLESVVSSRADRARG